MHRSLTIHSAMRAKRFIISQILSLVTRRNIGGTTLRRSYIFLRPAATLMFLLAPMTRSASAQQRDVIGIHEPAICAAGEAGFVIVSTGRGTPILRSKDLFEW